MDVIFYEKIGCINNTKQKKLLTRSGHRVINKDILEHLWTKKELVRFFSGKKIEECFNRSHPRIKSLEIDINNINFDRALSMMILDPLLIRRPLMIIEGRHMIGFELDVLRNMLRLVESPDRYEFEHCPKF